jgi:hypothetical protein
VTPCAQTGPKYVLDSDGQVGSLMTGHGDPRNPGSSGVQPPNRSPLSELLSLPLIGHQSTRQLPVGHKSREGGSVGTGAPDTYHSGRLFLPTK